MAENVVYHFIKYEHAKLAIINNSLKIATYDNLNDPFECFIHRLNHLCDDKKLIEALDIFKKEYGFLCFSSTYTEPLMWAHYTENHSGVCLGFKTKADLIEIDYVSQEKSFQNIKDLKANHLINFIKTKYDMWKYEHELRYIINLTQLTKCNDGNFYFPLNGMFELSEVYLGIRADSKIEEMKKLCSEFRKLNPNRVVCTDLSILDFKIKKKILPFKEYVCTANTK